MDFALSPPLLAAAGLTGVGLAALAWRAARASAPPAEPVAAPTGRTAAFPWRWFRPYRGAHRTTQADLNAFAAAAHAPGEPTFRLGGLLLSAEQELNRLILLTGRPDAGKTTLVLLLMADLARLWVAHPEFRQRWVFLDPSGTLPYLYRVVPPHVEIVRATPDDAGGVAPDFAADVRSESDILILGSCVFGEHLARQTADPFWTQMAREKFEDVIRVLIDRAADWGIWDPIVAIKYPQFLRPVLAQCPYTRGGAAVDLKGRMGAGITASARAVLNEMAVAASLWRHAPRRFSLRSFLDENSVLHLQFTPRLSKVVAGLYGAMTSLLTLNAMERQAKSDHTVLWLDEARYLGAGGLAQGLLGDVAARGRGAGVHAVVSTQSTAPLRKLLGSDGFEEFIDLVGTWLCLSAGPFTGKLFGDVCGDVEGEQESHGRSSAKGATESRSRSHSSSGTTDGWSVSHSVTDTTSTTAALAIKAAVLRGEVGNLPYADPKRDRIAGFFFNPNYGCGSFATDFLDHFKRLPPAPFADYPRRPAEQELLQPWTEAECRDRLRLDLTPDLKEAIRSTWAEFEEETI